MKRLKAKWGKQTRHYQNLYVMKLIFLTTFTWLDKTLRWDFNKMYIRQTEQEHFQNKIKRRNMLELDLSVKGNKSSQKEILSKSGCKPGTHGEKKRLFVLFQGTGPRIIL